MSGDQLNGILLCRGYFKHPITRQRNNALVQYIWILVDDNVGGYNKVQG